MREFNYQQFDPETGMMLRLKEAEQLNASARLLVQEGAQMLEEAHKRTAGRRYSVVRTINAARLRNRLDGIERETSEELARQMGVAHDPQKPFVPWSALAAQRTLITGTAAQGGNLVGKPASPAVDALLPYSTLVRLGSPVMDGLVGDLLIPRVTTSGTASWGGETGTAAAADQVLAQIAAKPKRVAAYTEISRQLLEQAPAIADAMVSRNLLGVVGAELDKAMLNGSGANQPTGIRLTSGATVTTGTGFTHANGQTMIKNAAAANVIDSNIAALGAPTVRETLSLRGLNGTGAEAGYVWQNGKFCSSVPAYVSGNVNAGQLFVGDFSQAWLLLWGGGLQLELNPYAQFAADVYGLKVAAYADVAVVQPAAFHVSTGLT